MNKKEIITKETLLSKTERHNTMYGVFIGILIAVSIISLIVVVGIFITSPIMGLIIGGATFIGLLLFFIIIGLCINSKNKIQDSIKYNKIYVTEGIVKSKFTYQNMHGQDTSVYEDTLPHYYVKLTNDEEIEVLENDYKTIEEKDLIYIIKTNDNKFLGAYSEKNYALHQELMKLKK